MVKDIGHFIGGKHVKGSSGRFADVFNPNTGEISARVALASPAELRAAVENAKAAQPEWAAKNPQVRARVMMRAPLCACRRKMNGNSLRAAVRRYQKRISAPVYSPCRKACSAMSGFRVRDPQAGACGPLACWNPIRLGFSISSAMLRNGCWNPIGSIALAGHMVRRAAWWRAAVIS